LSGTSIGALNAGILAQFPRDKQCTLGVAALERYWGSIRSSDDVWKTTQVPGRWDKFGTKTCLDPKNALAAVYGFINHGGFCDPTSGTENYYRAVNIDRIRTSGMSLQVTAASLTTGQPKVFTETSPNIIDGCMASGSIAPIVYPKRIGNDIFVDGGIFHNTPLLGSLDSTVTRAIVIELSPLDMLPAMEANSTDAAPITGFKILEYYLQALYVSIADRRELRDACEYFPHVQIEVAVPDSPVGSIVGFDPEAIEKLRNDGQQYVKQGLGPVYVCELLGVSKRHRLMKRIFGADPFDLMVSSVDARKQAMDIHMKRGFDTMKHDKEEISIKSGLAFVSDASRGAAAGSSMNSPFTLIMTTVLGIVIGRGTANMGNHRRRWHGLTFRVDQEPNVVSN